QRFGYDFGSVRVHHDARAAESARAVNAHAYTVGHYIAFNGTAFAPDATAGQATRARIDACCATERATLGALLPASNGRAFADWHAQARWAVASLSGSRGCHGV